MRDQREGRQAIWLTVWKHVMYLAIRGEGRGREAELRRIQAF